MRHMVDDESLSVLNSPAVVGGSCFANGDPYNSQTMYWVSFIPACTWYWTKLYRSNEQKYILLLIAEEAIHMAGTTLQDLEAAVELKM